MERYIELNIYKIGWRKVLRYSCLIISWYAIAFVFLGLDENSEQLELAKILTIFPGVMFLYLQIMSSSGLFKIKVAIPDSQNPPSNE